MRKIKFRMWSGIKMFYDWNVFECLKQQGNGIYDHEKDGAVFMQFIGIQDKNGKEIYEGDILQRVDPLGQRLNITLVTFLTHHSGVDIIAGFNTGQKYCGGNQIEVIGNAYENPELLKEVKS